MSAPVREQGRGVGAGSALTTEGPAGEREQLLPNECSPSCHVPHLPGCVHGGSWTPQGATLMWWLIVVTGDSAQGPGSESSSSLLLFNGNSGVFSLSQLTLALTSGCNILKQHYGRSHRALSAACLCLGKQQPCVTPLAQTPARHRGRARDADEGARSRNNKPNPLDTRGRGGNVTQAPLRV